MAKTVYLLCCCPRTGSTMFCESLADTGVAGRPMQYFEEEPAKEQRWIDELGILGEADYVDKILRRATSVNDVAGIRLHWVHAEIMARKLAANLGVAGAVGHAELPGLLQRKFGATPYIWLRRHNRVAQAISYARATATGVWLVQKAEGEGSEAAPPEFDVERIDRFMRILAELDQAWANFFLRHRIRPLMLIYEHLIRFREKTFRDTMDFLGVTEPPRLVEPRLRKLSDDVSTEWEQRYRKLRVRELGGIPAEG